MIERQASQKIAQGAAICADCGSELTAPFQESLFSTYGCVMYCCPKCIQEEVFGAGRVKDVKERMMTALHASQKFAKTVAICAGAECGIKLTAPFQESLFSTYGGVMYCCPKCIREEVEEDNLLKSLGFN
jgi:hypothetical protein